jgi:4-amino-4-deoxychorismate lyase
MFIETIAYEQRGYPLLFWHQKRLNRAFSMYFPNARPWELDQILPYPDIKERQKVRLVYSDKTYSIEVITYEKRDIQSAVLINAEDITYSHKYEDRSELEKLYHQRGTADEIIMVKKGLITDSFYANIVLEKNGHWYTPTTYMLNGVMRQYLLDQARISEVEVKAKHIKQYERIGLINALNPVGVLVFPVCNIIQ